jgi:DnaJ-class molecular chaperone
MQYADPRGVGGVIDCWDCGATGWQACRHCDVNGMVTCPTCHGYGQIGALRAWYLRWFG